MRVLVTGGAGFIGSHLVDRLAAAGHQVLVLDKLVEQVHPSGDWPEWKNPQAQYVRCPLSNNIRVRSYLGGKPLSTAANPALRIEAFNPEVIYHLAAEVGVGQAEYAVRRYVDRNCSDTAVVLEEMLKMDVRPQKVVVASSMSVYGEGRYACPHGEVDCPDRCSDPTPMPTHEDCYPEPTSVYAVTKLFQEQLTLAVCRNHGIPATALRFFNVYGPRQQLSNPYTGVCAIFMARLMNDQPPIIFDDGHQSRDFIFVSDIVEALALSMTNGEGVYNVCTGRKTTILEVASALRELVGGPPPEVPGKTRAGDIRHCFGDPSKARDELGFEASVSIEEGLRLLVEWSQTQDAVDRSEKAHMELDAHGLVTEAPA